MDDTTLPPPLALYRIATAHYLSQALYVAAEIGLADHLFEGPQTAEALARATGTHAPSLRRVMRLLVSAGVLREEDDEFASTPLSDAMRSVPGSSRSSVRLFAGPMQWKTWGALIDSVRTGEPAFERVHGAPSFEYLAARPDEAVVFDGAMSGFTIMAAKALASAYDWSSVGSVLDVGGGDGALIAGLLDAHAHLRGTVLDLERVERAARARLERHGERARFVAGDFFASVPSEQDVYLLKHVIHDWDDARATAILANVRRAMRADARVLVYEGVYPERVDAAALGAVANDCNMLVATGGRQRSEAEFRALFDAAGLRLARILTTPFSAVLEGVVA